MLKSLRFYGVIRNVKLALMPIQLLCSFLFSGQWFIRCCDGILNIFAKN